MASHSPTFFLTAAEHSGDALGAALIAALKKRYPSATFVGVGGPRMREAGCRTIADPTARSAMLIGAIFTEAKYWIGVMKLIRAEFAKQKPDVAIPIDSSAINLRIAGTAKEAGIPVCYYVAPQLWASRPWRIKKVRRNVDTLCCILPFEQEYFSSRGVKTVYVRHPMFDTPEITPENDPATIKPPLPGMNDEEVLGRKNLRVAVFPGSRKAEINNNLPPMLEMISEIKGRFPGTHFVAVSPSEDRAWQIRQHIKHAGATLEIHVGEADAIIRWADLCLTKSGTSTLQIARHHKPMVVMFAVAAWKWHLVGWWLVITKYKALVNVLANREIVREFIPFYGSPVPVAKECIRLLGDAAAREQMSAELAELVKPLRPGGDGRLAADRVADEVAKYVAG